MYHASKFNLTGFQTHDLQITDSAFYAPEMLALTTEPSGSRSTMFDAIPTNHRYP